MRDQSQIDDMRAAIRGDIERSRARLAEEGRVQPPPQRAGGREPEPDASPPAAVEPGPPVQPEPEPVVQPRGLGRLGAFLRRF